MGLKITRGRAWSGGAETGGGHRKHLYRETNQCQNSVSLSQFVISSGRVI